MGNYTPYSNQLKDIIQSGVTLLSDIKPSEWTEQNMVMGKPFPGLYKYSRTPYCREIIDTFAADHPMLWLAIMKGAQIGVSAGVIIPVLLWMIKNTPCNTYFLVGSPELVEKATEKLDLGIDGAGLRKYIKPQVLRKRAQKSGDTNSKKEFSGGYVHIGGANNHKSIRDVSLKMGLFDDFESVKSKSKESGDTRKLLEQRFAAYAGIHKIAYISTPEREETSNIKPAYLLGDQRKYLILCPCCAEYIELKWTCEDGAGKKIGGITWQLDGADKVISESVGYICQECGGFFDDKNKHELLNNGFWKPTAEPSKPGYYSYHISSLYAPLGMYDWEHYVNDYLEANPEGQPRNEDLHKTFINVVLGETYAADSETIRATDLQNNTRQYEIGVVPESLSIKDGNGKIVMLTCASDMNGKFLGVNGDEHDARLDYEILAHSESGATYSVQHGSIGTFIPNESGKKNKEVREKWTYEQHKENSVWGVFDELIGSTFETDTKRKMQVVITGVDTGFCEHEAFTYIERTNNYVIGLKGDKEDEFVPYGKALPNFKVGQSRQNLYMLRVSQLKDQLSHLIKLKWDAGNDDKQPSGFMNFPTPSKGLYEFKNYFSHFEAEHRILKDNKFVWQKKTTIAQNHLFDCRVYNLALKDIFVHLFFKEYKIKEYTWNDFCKAIL